jgi:ATP-dependent DNA helicase RecG
MDSAEFRRRLERRDDLPIEFREWLVDPDSAAAAIVAFALRLFQASESMYYDETRLVGLSVDELDPVAVDRFAEATGRPGLGLERDQLLRAWRLVRDGHPTVAGLLLFGRDPQRYLPTAQINAARVPGTEIANDPMDRKDLGGRLLDLVDQAERFLRLHLPRPHVIQGFAPEPRPELPETALREAVVNAVVHRDYTISAPIRLLIFDDRVEIRSPGRPPNGVDVDAMRAGAHVVRNPHLYARISDAGLVTGVGSGVPRLVRAIREAVGVEPVIEVHNAEVVLIVPRPAARTG